MIAYHEDPALDAVTDEDMTIEQLTAAVGLPFSTIRLYQHRGLLPPPERRGRVGYYGPEHLARLRLIAQLQERGYSLAAIRDLVDRWQHGQTLNDLLGLERQAAEVLGITPDEIRLRPDELADHFAGVELTPAAMTRAHALGLLAFDGEAVVIKAPNFLQVGAALAGMGIPIDEVLDEYEHLRATVDGMAARFAELFERNLWQPFVESGMPADRLPALTEDLARLGPLAEQVVLSSLRQALSATAARFLEEQAKALAPPSVPAKGAAARNKAAAKKASAKKASAKKASAKKAAAKKASAKKAAAKRSTAQKPAARKR